MDLSVAVFLYFMLVYFVFSPIAVKAFGYKDTYDEAQALQLSSHLYEPSSAGNNISINTIVKSEEDEDKISYYMEKIEYYYCTFKTTEAPDYNVEITTESGEKVLPSEYYTKKWFIDHFKDVDSVQKAREASVEALTDFQTYMKPYNRKIRRCELFIYIPPYFVSSITFFLVFPLVFKNGETLGKKSLGIGYATIEGYAVKKRLVLFRQLFIIFGMTVFAFPLGNISIISFIMLAFGVAVYYIAAFIPKSKRSIADWIAYTQLIDTKNSVWFKDKFEEEAKASQVEENLAKLNKYKEENKNLLQVGSTIVNEEAKQEIEESKRNENEEKK